VLDAYKAIVNKSTDYITLIDRDYVYRIANDAYCSQMGKRREDVVGHTVAEVWGEERFIQVIKPYLDRCLAGKQVNYVDKFTFGPIERHIRVSYFPYIENGATSHALVFSHDISRLSKVEDRLTNYEVRDPTTGLFNRRSMEIILDKEVERARDARIDRRRSLMFISIMNIDRIVDLYGHEIGDLILENTGLRILSCLAAHDTVFRFEGAKLTVLITSIHDHVELATTALEIYQEISLPYYHGGATLALDAAIGISIFPEDASTREDMIRNAHMAMSDARQRCVPYVFFDEELHRQAHDRLVLGTEMAHALSAHQFEVYYQPMVDAKARVVGCEALLRWNHPERGMVPPNDIIPFAVDSGIIVSIGRWVLFTACEQIKNWSSYLEMFVTVNLSAGEFLDEYLLENVERAIARSGIRPSQIKLEITESDALRDAAEATRQINELARLGVDVLIDDFGTGQSSLSYLRNLPARFLKLDQEFCRELEEAPSENAFLAHVIQAIKSLDKTVILEGVNSRNQARNGVLLNIDLLQGNLFGKAMPASRFEELLERTRHPRPTKK